MNICAVRSLQAIFKQEPAHTYPHEPKSEHPDGSDGTTAYAVCKHCGSIFAIET